MRRELESGDAVERHALEYQPRLDQRLLHSRFGVVAVSALLLAFALFVVDLARRPVLVFPACAFLWLIGIVLTAAAYTRKGSRSLTLAHLGVLLIVVDFLMTTLLPSI